jgi:hypothetical protein
VGDGDAAGRRGLLHAFGKADCRAQSIVVGDDHVGEDHRGAHDDRFVLGEPIAAGHRQLKAHGPFDHVEYALEFDQRPVAHGLDDLAVIFRQGAADEIFVDRAELAQVRSSSSRTSSE